jgi:hypothetical protein
MFLESLALTLKNSNMSNYLLQFPNEDAPEARALLRYLSELAFVRLAPQPAPNDPVFMRPTETQRQQGVEAMLHFLANRPNTATADTDNEVVR